MFRQVIGHVATFLVVPNRTRCLGTTITAHPLLLLLDQPDEAQGHIPKRHRETVFLAVVAPPGHLSCVPLDIGVVCLEPRDGKVPIDPLLETRDLPSKLLLVGPNS